MQHQGGILVLGAGKSSAYLIRHLAQWCASHHVELILADLSAEALANARQRTLTTFREVVLDKDNEGILIKEIAQAFLVVSMLPVAFHAQVASYCLEHEKHLLTASYITPEINRFSEEVQRKGLTFLFECGLDPGIDHMSAFDLLARIRSKGERITSFISCTGGLVDPACEGANPWQYKFTWNPRNVVLAGKGTAVFCEEKVLKEVPYDKLFATAKVLHWKGDAALEYYPNRDSLKYQQLYELQEADTFIRGTIRRKGYSEAWNVLVQLGMTDDEMSLQGIASYADFFKHALAGKTFTRQHVEQKSGIPISDSVWEKMQYLYTGSEAPVNLPPSTAAGYLQQLLEKKWALQAGDKDWVFMQHRIRTEKDGKQKEYTSTLSVRGENEHFTAMAKTVGLPLAMAAVAVYTGTWRKPGIHIPSDPDLYRTLLTDLEREGLIFEED